MFLANPLVLAALVPFAVVVLYLLRRRRGLVLDVPFLELWQSAGPQSNRPRRMHIPPLAVLLFLAGILFTIIAAARPMVRGLPRGGRRPIILLIDRGITMSGHGSEGLRFVEVAHRVADEMVRKSGLDTPIEVYAIPGADRPIITDATGLAAFVSELLPTAVDTRQEIIRAVARHRKDTDDALIVLTDADLRDEAGVTVVPPVEPLENVCIAGCAFRELPVGQLMVTLFNASSASSATIHISDGLTEAERSIDLPRRGESRNYFIDVERISSPLTIRLDVPDQLAADNVMMLVKQAPQMRIAVRGSLPQTLQRMVDVYNRIKRPENSAGEAIISETPVDVGTTGAIIAAPASVTGSTIGSSGDSESTLSIVPHPLTESVHWEQFLHGPHFMTALPAGFSPVVTLADRPLLAVRDKPARQVWVGFDADSRSVDYVLFWTNVFDYLASSDPPRYIARTLPAPNGWRLRTPADPQTQYEPGTAPGLYVNDSDPTGAVTAFNAPNVMTSAVPSTLPTKNSWSYTPNPIDEGRALTSPLLLASLLLVLGGCLAIGCSHRAVRTLSAEV